MEAAEVKMKTLLAALILSFLSLAVVGLAEAGIIQYTDRATFESQGAILYNYDFEDVTFPDTGGYASPAPQPWPTHGVTYEGDRNLLLLPACDFEPESIVLANWDGLITATPEIGHNMLAMDVAAAALPGGTYPPLSTTITLKTNLNPGGYDLIALSDLPLVSAGQKFFGFVTDSSEEYFTEFVVNYNSVDQVQATIDNVTLGVVPEPGVLALLGTALLGLGGFLVVRRKCPGKR